MTNIVSKLYFFKTRKKFKNKKLRTGLSASRCKKRNKISCRVFLEPVLISRPALLQQKLLSYSSRSLSLSSVHKLVKAPSQSLKMKKTNLSKWFTAKMRKRTVNAI